MTLDHRTVVHVGAYKLTDEDFRHITAILRLAGVAIFGEPVKDTNFYRAYDHLLVFEDGPTLWATRLLRDLGYKLDPIMSELTAAEANNSLAPEVRGVFVYRRRIV